MSLHKAITIVTSCERLADEGDGLIVVSPNYATNNAAVSADTIQLCQPTQAVARPMIGRGDCFGGSMDLENRLHEAATVLSWSDRQKMTTKPDSRRFARLDDFAVLGDSI